jgi:hypothetical protein
VTRPAAIALLLVATVTAAGATTAATTAMALYGGGSLAVEVEQLGSEPLSLRFRVPAVALGPVADWALMRWNPGPSSLPEGVDARWLAVAHGAIEALEQTPDGVLVAVEDGPETVLVEKQGSSLVVSVITESERVRVEVPLRLFARVLDRLDCVDLPSSGRA